jgi:hypothetical protein
MAQSNIILDGGEVSILKAIGFGSGEVPGDQLLQRVQGMEFAEIVDALGGLIAMGYVIADRSSFQSEVELKSTNFHVNSGYSRDLKEAIDPQPGKPKSRRVRRE